MPPTSPLHRRELLAGLAALGVSSSVWQRAVAQQLADQGRITLAQLEQAEWIAGLELTSDERQAIHDRIQNQLVRLDELRATTISYSTPPAVQFAVATATPPLQGAPQRTAQPRRASSGQRPADNEDLAFLPVTELAALIRTRQVTSTELTELYLARLERYDPLLRCVVTRTDELARRQAERADRELSRGIYRGPLHGIPWGAKDLIAYPGYPTTWGATPFRERILDEKATVAARLESAGAVLVAKLSLGALAMGDRWFGQMTRNPWNPTEGSSGSSAGSAAATAAGLVGFSLGSETLGSIISPCRRCGATGLRPTFGRVSRFGCMTLSWSMDKIGPITRSVEDAALIFDAIHGADSRDPAAVTHPFCWPSTATLPPLRVGYVADEAERYATEIEILRDLGLGLVPLHLPSQFPTQAVSLMLDVEAATVFDELTRGKVTQDLNDWPDIFRAAEFVPAIEYLRANRIRTQMMQAIEAEVFQHVDLYLGGEDLAFTNLTGHPSLVIPNGLTTRDEQPVPKSLKMTGQLFGEETLLAVADAYQLATGHHLQRPPLAKLE